MRRYRCPRARHVPERLRADSRRADALLASTGRSRRHRKSVPRRQRPQRAEARSRARRGHARRRRSRTAGRRVHAGGNQARGGRLRTRREAPGRSRWSGCCSDSTAAPTPHDAADALAVAICHVHASSGAVASARTRRAAPPRSWRQLAAIRPARGRHDRASARPALREASQRVIVDAGGVGYDVHVPLSTFSVVGEPGARRRAAHPHACPRGRAAALRVRDRARAGRCSIGWSAVSGIGPKLALAVLSGIEPRDLVARDRARRHRAAGRDSRHRQEDRGAHRARAEGRVPRARRRHGRGAPRRATACATDLLSALRESGLPSARGRESGGRGAQRSGGSFERALRSGAGVADARRDEIASSTMTDPIASSPPSRVDEDAQYEAGLRPRTLDDYIGQDRVRENLQVSIAAARSRGEALDHVLLYGPPGLGKTTLAYVIAQRARRRRSASTAGPGHRAPGRSRGDAHRRSASAKCCSSTRFTAWRRRSKRSSIPRWRTSSSTS